MNTFGSNLCVFLKYWLIMAQNTWLYLHDFNIPYKTRWTRIFLRVVLMLISTARRCLDSTWCICKRGSVYTAGASILRNCPSGVCCLSMGFFSYLVKLCLSLTSRQASSDLWNVLLPTRALSWTEAGQDMAAIYWPRKGSQGTQLQCIFACRSLDQPSFAQAAADLTENCLGAWMPAFSLQLQASGSFLFQSGAGRLHWSLLHLI